MLKDEFSNYSAGKDTNADNFTGLYSMVRTGILGKVTRSLNLACTIHKFSLST